MSNGGLPIGGESALFSRIELVRDGCVTMTNKTKTIRVSEDNHKELWKFKESPEDTFDDALRRVLSRVDQ